MKSDTEITLGQALPENLIGVRDALHVPVICVTAHKRLSPGDWVGVKDNETVGGGSVGIVDPFRGVWVAAGEVVAILLMPKSTSNVRHTWEHPAIDTQAPPAKPAVMMTSGEWRKYRDEVCRKLGCSVYVLEDGISHMIEYGTKGGGTQPNLETTANVDWTEFWQKYNQSHGTNYGWTEDPFCC